MTNTVDDILMETVTKFIKELSTKEIINEAEAGMFPEELWKSIGEMGLTKMAIEEDKGGTGFEFKDALNVLRVIGKYATPVPLAETLTANWLKDIAGMEIDDNNSAVILNLESLVIGESDTGFSLNGKVKNVPFARYMDTLLIIISDDSGANYLFEIEMKDLFVNEGKNLAGEARDTVVIHDYYLPRDKGVKIADDLDDIMQYVQSLTRVVLMAGALEKILELTIQYAQERVQFNRPIGKFQAIKQQIAIMTGHISAAATAADYAIESFDLNRLDTSEIMIAKTVVGEITDIVVPIAHQIHAAIGFTYEYPLHHTTRRLWSWRDEGASEHEWAKVLGERILDREEGIWEMITSNQF